MQIEESELQIPPKYRSAVDATKCREWFLPVVEKYLEDPDKRRNEGQGVILAGSHGAGKTWTACALAKTLDKVAQRRVVIVFQHAADLAARLYPFGESPWVPSWDMTYDQVMEACSCLIVDDLGHEAREGGSSRIVLSKFNRLFRKRMGKRLVTMVTTNLSLKEDPEDEKSVPEIVTEMSSAFASLLSELCPFGSDVGMRRDIRDSSSDWSL